MKNLRKSLLLLLSVVLLMSCVKWPEDEVTPTAPDSHPEYNLKSSNVASFSGDTLLGIEGVLYLFTLEKSGVKIKADFDLANGTPIVTADLTSGKFNKGLYVIKATDKSVTPNVTKTKLFKVTKEVLIPSISGEIIVLISNTMNGTINNAVFGLRCDAINGNSSNGTAQLRSEMTPSVLWPGAQTEISEVVTVNNVKYYKWSIAVPNNQKLRFSYYINDTWAYMSKSVYRQADGMYVIYMKDGVIGKDVLVSNLPGKTGDSKVRLDVEVLTETSNLWVYVNKSAFSNSISPSLKYNIRGFKTTVLFADAGDYYNFS